jgi:pyruvate-ferredoxin/flavodoxin oxidoreductase
MLPQRPQRKFFYLSVDFARDPLNPKDELHQQDIADAYPAYPCAGVRGSENPNLMPKGAITVRMHSVGGWGAITTGKNLAMTLFELLGWDIKANPKYGSEKKGQPTTYYLSAAPEPIRVNCEYVYVDVVLSPDPARVGHSNPLAGLKKGGVFIIQSNLGEETWASFPLWAEADRGQRDPRLLPRRLPDRARGGRQPPSCSCACRASPSRAPSSPPVAGDEERRPHRGALFRAIEDQLQSKFGGKGARVVADNLRVVRRGFTELQRDHRQGQSVQHAQTDGSEKDAGLPVMLRSCPAGDARHGKVADIHRFWEQTGSFYADRQGQRQPGRPLHRRLAGAGGDRRLPRHDRHPLRAPGVDRENCTACGNCYTECPDSAIPGLVKQRGRCLQHGADAHRSAAARRRATCAAPCARSKRSCAR